MYNKSKKALSLTNNTTTKLLVVFIQEILFKVRVFSFRIQRKINNSVFFSIFFFIIFAIILPYLTLIDQEPLNKLIINLSKYFNINFTQINVNLSEISRIFFQTSVWLFVLTFIFFINKQLVEKNKLNKNKFKLWNSTLFNILNVVALVLCILVFINILIRFVDIELLTSILYIYDLEIISPFITKLENFENLINDLVFGYFFIILLLIFINHYNDL